MTDIRNHQQILDDTVAMLTKQMKAKQVVYAEDIERLEEKNEVLEEKSRIALEQRHLAWEDNQMLRERIKYIESQLTYWKRLYEAVIREDQND